MTDYWSLDAALAEETLVPTVFPAGLQGLAKALDPGTTAIDLDPGTRVDAALWLSAPLMRRGMAHLGLPEVYNERYQRKLNAGAECVNFKGRAPYFYEVGNRCNEFLHSIELSGFLTRTFKARYQHLVSKGLDAVSGEDVLELQSKLSVEELALFDVGRISVHETERWNRDSKRGMTTAKSRKRAAQHEAAAEEEARQTNKEARQ